MNETAVPAARNEGVIAVAKKQSKARKTKAATKRRSTAKKKSTNKRTTAKPRAVKISVKPSKATRQYMRALMRTPDDSYQAAKEAYKKWRKRLESIKGVISVDVGMKIQGGHSTREFAIRVYVKEKCPNSELAAAERIPEQCDGIPTDVRTCEYLPAASGARPEGGDKLLNPASAFGTLGFGVLRLADNRERYLTCTHVISATNAVTVPTLMRDASGNSIGTAFPNNPNEVNWVYSRRLDCALIAPPNPSQHRVTIPRAGARDPMVMRRVTPADMVHDRLVWKWGAATGERFGRIDSIDARPPFKDGTIGIDQIEISSIQPGQPFAIDGDSGSILCVNDEAVGIIRAVNDSHTAVIACPLHHPGGQGAADKLGFFLL